MKTGIRLLCCIAIIAMSFESTYAQSLGSLLSGAKKVLEEKITGGVVSQDALVGTWDYSKPAIKLQSSNTLADLGGEAVSTQICDKLNTYYEKIGLKKGAFSITFTSDGKVSTKVLGKDVTGTYSIGEDGKTLNIGYKEEGKTVSTSISLASNNLSITLGGEKFMTFIQTVIEKIPANGTIESIQSLLKNYNGLLIGFEFTKSSTAATIETTTEATSESTSESE